MTRAFPDALAVVLREEGGFVDNDHDPGGMTNHGVTAKTWAAWTGRPATTAIMHALTPAMVAPLYKARYWDQVGGDHLPISLGLAVFDFGVNAGPRRAVDTLQAVVGVHVDGQFGPGTLAAVAAGLADIGVGALIREFCNMRRDFYRQDAGFPTFGNGWLARVDRVQQEALSWVG